jgi:bifunctional UDP-N-acetylglucosamine pyrophosphorylase/glucosamine-1-phosphate N-acetyltransferase
MFDADWLWSNIDNLKNDNVQGEYYITDLIKMAKEQNKRIIAIPVSEESEALGINTQEQLKEAEQVLESRK